MVLAAVAAYLELRPKTVQRALLLRDEAAFQYPLYVAVEVEGPLIEIAGGDGDEAGGAASRHGDGGGAWMRTPNYL